MGDINPEIIDKAVEEAVQALRVAGLADADGCGYVLENVYADGAVHVALTAALPHLEKQIREQAALSAVADDLRAAAWDEGAEAAWERSTPEVNGQTHHWRREGEPLNPYRNACCPHSKCPGGSLCCCQGADRCMT